MKLFKRTARDAEVLNPADTTSSPRRRSAGLKTLTPGLLPGLLGLAAAGALLWLAYQTSLQQHTSELAKAWGQSQASAVEQALRQLADDTQAAARAPQLLDALRSEQSDRIRAAERELVDRDGIIDAHISLRGQARQNPDRPGPLNFAALELLQRAENGTPPAPEAFKVGNRWLLYSAAAL
jgi:phosphomannomutase/phosphoglucomutase